MDDFPSNSRIQRTPPPKPAPAPEPEAPKFEKLNVGPVIRRKKPLGRRLMQTFFGQEGVLSYVTTQVLIPAIQQLAADAIRQGTEKAIFGEVRTPMRGPLITNVPRTHMSYNGISRPTPASAGVAPPTRPPSHQPSSMIVEDVVLESRAAAEAIVDRLYEILQEYGAVTVANLNEQLEVTSAYTDNKYGWTDLSGIKLERTREGYTAIVFPRTEILR